MITRTCIPVFTTMTLAAGAFAQTSGRPVASMTIFDTQMSTFMVTNNIEAGVLGIMHNGEVCYLRGFGSMDSGVNMPENALVRLASCTKTITAAAIRRMDEQNILDVGDFAFNINGNGGLLNYAGFPSFSNPNAQDDITVNHLLQHRGGWNRDIAGDLTYRERDIADDMSVSSPPGRVNTMRWILGQPLQFTPGSQYQYSNIGYLALGLMVSTMTPPGYIGYVEQNVLTPAMWVPNTEIAQSRTFRADRNAREPWYRTNQTVASVFDSVPGFVPRCYGGVDMEARLGQGGVIASAPFMLEIANRYHISPGSSIIGLPIDTNNPLTGNEGHNGGQSGVNTYLWHRTDGVCVFVFFNKDKGEYAGSGHYGNDMISILGPILDAGTQFTWPNAGVTSDGAWVNTSGVALNGLGGYNAPLGSFVWAVASAGDGTKLRLKSGSANWTGTITKRLLIDAPGATATIGQ